MDSHATKPTHDRADLGLLAEDFQEARLCGVPCRALAWIEDPAGAVKRWRGVALCPTTRPRQWHFNVPLRYEGKIAVGGRHKEISADVFIYETPCHGVSSTRRAIIQSEDALANDAEECVYFIGAGNIPTN